MDHPHVLNTHTHTYIHTYVCTYIYTYMPWIHKCVIKTVGCGASHKDTYTNSQCTILQTFYKNVINQLFMLYKCKFISVFCVVG